MKRAASRDSRRIRLAEQRDMQSNAVGWSEIWEEAYKNYASTAADAKMIASRSAEIVTLESKLKGI